MERDWFLERLQLIAHDILTVEEREEKEKRRWTHLGPLGLSALTQNEMASASHLEKILLMGIQVCPVVLHYDLKRCSFLLPKLLSL